MIAYCGHFTFVHRGDYVVAVYRGTPYQRHSEAHICQLVNAYIELTERANDLQEELDELRELETAAETGA